MLWRHELTPTDYTRTTFTPEEAAQAAEYYLEMANAYALESPRDENGVTDLGTFYPLAQQVDYLPGQVISKTLAQNSAFGLTLFAIDKGEEISAHRSTGDALVIALDGTGEITIDDTKHMLHAGECIVMPAGHPHAVRAPEAFKMLLIVVFPPESATD